ncbi:MAG: hydroxypyruvate isomerase family protein [Planctomycetota bacterium]|jgi:hydroxypyruvate isomerase
MKDSDQFDSLSRRSFGKSALGLGALATTGALGTATLGSGAASGALQVGADEKPADAKAGRLNQSLCKWCYDKNLSLEELCVHAKKMGLVGIDLLGPKDFETLKKHGLVCTMVTSHKLTDGLCDPKYWDEALRIINESIEAASSAGFRNVICFSGNARGIDRKTGMKNCAEALRKIVSVAEKKKVILNMELLNSRVDHADYMCDLSAWGIELCKQVASDHFKLLYDIYHMQIMEGDIIRSIQSNHKYFGHYHTGGNPGRHEIDHTQEIYYPPIAKAIAESGFDGYVAHEFLPTGDTLESLSQAVKICTV